MPEDRQGKPRLVRARPKSPEYLPEDFRCCDKAQRIVLGLGEMMLDLSRQRMDHDMACCHCGADRIDGPAAPDIADGCYVHLSILDLDEGSFQP